MTTDIAWICISRFILLDSMLLFFTFLTVFCLTKFHNQQQLYVPSIRIPACQLTFCSSFSFDWWMWLAFTGVSIGLVTRFVTSN